MLTMFDHSSFGRASTNTGTATPSIASPGAESRRRYALQYLGRFEYPVELRTLAASVAAALEMVPIETVSEDERERVAIRLHHIDIPKLVAEGIVEYDRESRMVVRTGTVDGAERYADVGDRSRRSV